MSQPTLSTGFSAAGITTLVWGTDGLLQSPSPGANYAGTGYYIVESVDESEKAEQVYGENGTGIEAWRVNLRHGVRWNITVQDDVQWAAPVVGSTVNLVDLVLSTTSNSSINGTRKVYTGVVLSNDYRAARKQAGHRVIQVENLTLVDSQATTNA